MTAFALLVTIMSLERVPISAFTIDVPDEASCKQISKIVQDHYTVVLKSAQPDPYATNTALVQTLCVNRSPS